MNHLWLTVFLKHITNCSKQQGKARVQHQTTVIRSGRRISFLFGHLDIATVVQITKLEKVVFARSVW